MTIHHRRHRLFLSHTFPRHSSLLPVNQLPYLLSDRFLLHFLCYVFYNNVSSEIVYVWRQMTSSVALLPVPGAHPPLRGGPLPFPEEGPDQRREATIELCTRRYLRLGTRFARPDVRVLRGQSTRIVKFSRLLRLPNFVLDSVDQMRDVTRPKYQMVDIRGHKYQVMCVCKFWHTNPCIRTRAVDAKFFLT